MPHRMYLFHHLLMLTHTVISVGVWLFSLLQIIGVISQVSKVLRALTLQILLGNASFLRHVLVLLQLSQILNMPLLISADGGYAGKILLSCRRRLKLRASWITASSIYRTFDNINAVNL